MGFPSDPSSSNLPASAEDMRRTFDPGSGRSPGGEHENPLQYSCMGNSIDRGAWKARAPRSQRVRHDWINLACMHTSLKYSIC